MQRAVSIYSLPYISLLVPFALALVLTVVLCRYASPLGQWLGVMDLPSGDGGHKKHARPTPAVGGLILGFVSGLVVAVTLPWSDPSNGLGQSIRLMSLVAVIATMAIGFLDDRRHIPALTRLLLGSLISALLLLAVPELQVQQVAFSSIGLVVRTEALAIPFTVLCLQGLKNAVNMADGRNGVLLGMTLIWNIFFLFHAFPPMIPTMVGVLGCLTVLLICNLRGKLFMGDCGAYGIAKYYGILALGLHQNAFGNVRSAEVVLLFLVPVIDTIRLIVIRLLNGHSPMAPDGRHLHHLLDNAIGWAGGWFVYMALIVCPLVVYQLLPGNGVQIIALAIGAYSLVVWVCSKMPRRSSHQDEVDAPSG